MNHRYNSIYIYLWVNNKKYIYYNFVIQLFVLVKKNSRNQVPVMLINYVNIQNFKFWEYLSICLIARKLTILQNIFIRMNLNQVIVWYLPTLFVGVSAYFTDKSSWENIIFFISSLWHHSLRLRNILTYSYQMLIFWFFVAYVMKLYK